eukprot:m.139483 g.139483  ORF g.139483 m.139483 type:complete len:69 (+) comp17627_c0_seq1:800-1006(+)
MFHTHTMKRNPILFLSMSRAHPTNHFATGVNENLPHNAELLRSRGNGQPSAPIQSSFSFYKFFPVAFS